MKAGISSVSLVMIALAATTTHAHAYIDPVTGSFVIQGIAAGFAGIMVAFRSVRQKVFAMVCARRPGSDRSGRHDS